MGPTSLCIPDLLMRQAERIPTAPAILAPGRALLSYGALWRRVGHITRILHATGLGRRDRVALVLSNGPDMAVACLAVTVGATCTPLNPAYSADEFRSYMSAAGTRTLLVQADLDSPARDIARSAGIQTIELSPISNDDAGLFTLPSGGPGAIPFSLARPDDVALALHTAGTTSRPKIVPLTHTHLCVSADNIRRAVGLAESDRCLNVMPLFHVHGLVGALLASLVAGASVVCTPGFSAPHFLEWMAGFRPTWYTAVPTIHQAVLAQVSSHPSSVPHHPLRFIRSTSAALPPRILADLESVFNAPVIEAYGTTETSMITCNPLPPAVRKSGSVGVMAGPEVAVMGANGDLRPAGESGEIIVRGATVVPGYENDPLANAAAFANGWFRTGDEGYFDADGYLFITGRIKETINRGGESIGPQEVDAVLMDHPAVAQAISFAVPHARLVEDIAAAVVLRPHSTATASEIRQFAAGRLAAFKVPQRVFVVSSLCVSPTGKPQRAGMAARLGLDGLEPPPTPRLADDRGPSTAVEEILLGLWSHVLALPQIRVDDNFFALGGDSILAAQLLSRTSEALHVEVPFRSFFEMPTVAGMARTLVTVGCPAQRASLQPVPRNDGLPLSYAQQRLWFLEHLGLSGHAYHLLEVVQIRGPLRTETLTQSLRDVIERHDILRTRFVSLDGNPRQVIEPPGSVPLPVVDLRSVPAGELQERTSALALGEARRPFDLSRGPLIRATLLRLADEDHVLLLTMHHIVSDGWSYAVFWRELAALYEAHLAGTLAPLDPLAIQYADFAYWERRWLDDDALAIHLAYWKRALAGISRLELLTDRPRPPVRSFQGAREPVEVPARLTQALKALSQRAGVTLFMTLLAAFQTFLHRYTAKADIAVGTLIANRTRAEIEGLIGFFVNTLVMRTDFSGDPGFRELLERVRDVALGAYSHQHLPFDKLVEEMQPHRDLSHHPLFDVLFVFQNAPRAPLALAGLTLSAVELDSKTAKFDLTLELAETPAGVVGWFEYSTDLFDAPTIKRMAEHLLVLLEGIAANPAEAVSRLPLLTPAEKFRLLVEWNDTGDKYPDKACIEELFAAQVELTPDAIALACSDRHLTYEQLNRSANRLAHYLVTLGVGPGVFVGICLPRSLELIIGFLGILKAGGVYLPLDPTYPEERLAFILKDSQAPVVLTDQMCRALFTDLDSRFVCLDAIGDVLARQRDDNPLIRNTSEELAYVIYTSGSTGHPKGVAAPHRQVLNRLTWMWTAYPFAHGEMACQQTALNFVDSIWELLGALLKGVPTVIIPDRVRQDPAAFVRTLEEHGVTRLWVVPSLLQLLLDRFPDLQQRLPRLTFWVTSGEALSRDLYRHFQARMPNSVLYNLYGISEVWDISWYRPHPHHDALPMVPIGRPIANVQVYVLDQHLQPVPIGVAGELYVGGAGLPRGYLTSPQLTAERFLPNPFSPDPEARLYKTGDVARYLPDGNLEFRGRVDDQIKLRGYRIEPREIELALEQHPAIRHAVVIAREGTPGDLRLIAYVVAQGDQRPSTRALRRFLHTLVPDHMVPSAFVTLDRFPLTPSGKVNRRALPTPDDRRPVLQDNFVAPRTATEAALARIWAQLLRVDRVGVHDNFFELGGHSLLAMQLLSLTHTATGIEIPLPRFFAAPTVADAAVLIDTAHPTLPAVIPTAPRRQSLPASATQEHLWHLDCMHPGSSAFNISYAVRLRGALDRRVLDESVDALLRRHEGLRTTFKLVDNHLVRVIASKSDLPVTIVDLQAISISVREDETRRLATAAARRPFNLARGPLLRLTLWQQNPDEHLLLLTMHHIIADAWSIGILVRDLAALYNAHPAGTPITLPALPIQHSDFAYWQRRWQCDATLRADLAFWKVQLRGPLRPLRLPTDRPRVPNRMARAARLSIAIPRSLSDALTTFSHSEGNTLFMTVLAALKILLYAYTGEEDQRVATLLANRQRRDTEGVIGLFADMAILRTNLGGTPSCRDVLRRVRATALEAYGHQEFPFEELVRALERERGLARASLSQVMLLWQNAFRLPPQLTATPLSFLEMDQQWLAPETVVTSFDIILDLRERAQGIVGSCLYNALLFDAATIRTLLRDFQAVLEAMLAEPERSLAAFRALRAQRS